MAIDEETRAKIIELDKQNNSLREIAGKLGIGKSTVSTVLKKAAAAIKPVDAPPAPPEIIISDVVETNMDTAVVDNFMNSLTSGGGGGGSAPKPVPAGQDAFIQSLMKDLATDEKPKARGRQAKAPVEKPTRIFEPPAQLEIFKAPVADKGELIGKITLNAQTFPDMFKDILKPTKEDFIANLPKKSTTELTSLLSMIEYQRSVTNTANVMKSITVTGAAVLEMGTKKFLKMRTDGFAEMIRAMPELDGILKEIAMENQSGIISRYQSPTVRLTALVVTTLMAVDAKNRTSTVQAPMPQDIQQEYTDM
jgi:hypothetical protein